MAGHLMHLGDILLNDEDELRRVDLIAGIVIGISPIIHLIIVSGIDAPYGRYTSERWGFGLDAKFAWFMQELPALIIPCFVYINTDTTDLSYPAIFLLAAFLIHYFNRVFIYSMSIKGGKPTPLIICAMATSFCAINGYMQAIFLIRFSQYKAETFLEWNFVIGMCIFLFGFYTNIQCDAILRNLREPGSKAYKIPYGSMFDYVSAGNLWGEAVEWSGWALACWSLQGFAFATFAVLYLSARSYSHHVWYKKKFDDYPKDRKIFVPYLV